IEGVVDKQEDNENKTVVDDDMSAEVSPSGFWRKLVEALRYGFIDFLGDISKWLVIGLLVAALITTLVPHDFMETMNLSPILQMLLIIVVAVPMYVCATGSIPVAAGLVAVGVDPGAAFVFLMAGPATNAATITILRKTLGQRALLVYLSTIISGALIGGVVISYLLPTDWFAVASRGVCGECVVGDGIGLVPIVCGVIMAALVVWSFVSNKICGCHKSFDEAGCAPAEIIAVFKVKNMTCSHCKANVESAAKSVDPGLFAEANVSEATLVVRGLSVETEKIVEAVSQMGYDISLLSQRGNSQPFKNSKQKHDER
ncbi:MAG: permease, partial [Prevotellaceae bacterium]|nr:permease [Prevotellaceae bacterium]